MISAADTQFLYGIDKLGDHSFFGCTPDALPKSSCPVK